MKKLLLLFLLTGAQLSISGCSKKDEPAPVTSTALYSQLILGKWVSSSSVTATSVAGAQPTTTTTYTTYGDVYEVFAATTVEEFSKTATISAARPYTIAGNTYTIQDTNSVRSFEIVSLTTSSFVRRSTSTSGTTTTVTTTTLLR